MNFEISFVPIDHATPELVSEAIGAVAETLRASGATKERILARVAAAHQGEAIPTTDFLLANGIGAGWASFVPYSSGRPGWWESSSYIASYLQGQGIFDQLMCREVHHRSRILAEQPSARFVSSMDSTNLRSIKAHLSYFFRNQWAEKWEVINDPIRQRVSCVLEWPGEEQLPHRCFED